MASASIGCQSGKPSICRHDLLGQLPVPLSQMTQELVGALYRARFLWLVMPE
jgi:hypothetical protein